jgi:hypothetical protein
MIRKREKENKNERKTNMKGGGGQTFSQNFFITKVEKCGTTQIFYVIVFGQWFPTGRLSPLRNEPSNFFSFVTERKISKNILKLEQLYFAL